MNNGSDKNLFEIISHKENVGETPLVTVIITLFNYQNFITHCLDSVKGQTIDRLSLVVVDDCSTDRSVEKSKKWLGKNGSRFYEIT